MYFSGLCQSPENGNWIVTLVVDGDTFYAAKDNIEKKFRLIGIDAPESCHPNRPLEPFAIESKTWLENLVSDSKIRLEFDGQRTDRYGRHLVYAFNRDGTFVNRNLLESGLAAVMTIPPNVKYLEILIESTEKAKFNKLGIWRVNNE